MLVLVVVMAGCASPGLHAFAPAGSPPGRSPASFPSPAAAASTSLGASTTLAAFFAAAKQVDGRLRQAATLVNGGIGSDQIRRSQATIDALHALNPGEAAAAVPAGLPTGLLRHVLVVQSDLASRTDAVDGILELWRPGLFPATDRPALLALRCLGQGAASAAQLSADLGAAGDCRRLTAGGRGATRVSLRRGARRQAGIHPAPQQRVRAMWWCPGHPARGCRLARGATRLPRRSALGGSHRRHCLPRTHTPARGWQVELRACRRAARTPSVSTSLRGSARGRRG